VDDQDLVRQHSKLMSPLVWDLAHIGSQEELWLVRDVGGREPVRADLDEVYDAFRHSRASRPSLPMLAPAEARRYVGEVRSKSLEILEKAPLQGRRLTESAFAFGMITQHEQQHDETMLATHQLRKGEPVLHAPAPPPARAGRLPAEVFVPAGPFTMGTTVEPWALDNERPAHEVLVQAYFIDTTPVTNAAYVEFLESGGYDDPRWWSPPGWAYRSTHGITAPRFWRREPDGWWRTRFGVDERVSAAEPVVHVSFYEAEAYARWAGKRLPVEQEWEKAARFDPRTGHSADSPGVTRNRVPSTPISASVISAPPRWARTRQVFHRWACTS
jgi:iron(II)-dependent oxidoreductase